MARQRERAREAQRREEVQERVADLRHEARRWWIRAVLAALAGGLVSLAFVGIAVVCGILAVVCLGLGMREAIAAQRLEDGR